MKQELTAAKVFSSITVFDLLRDTLYMLGRTVPLFIQGTFLAIARDACSWFTVGKVSIKRVNDFLVKVFFSFGLQWHVPGLTFFLSSQSCWTASNP